MRADSPLIEATPPPEAPAEPTAAPEAPDPPVAADPLRIEAEQIAAPYGYGRTARLRRLGTVQAERASRLLEENRKRFLPVELAATYVERDREALVSVLGAAVALRLYLYLIPATATIVGLLITVIGEDKTNDFLSDASVSGTVARDITAAAASSTTTGIVLVLVGTWLTLWAGRNLTMVLTACAGRAWRLPPEEIRSRLYAMGGVTGATMLMLMAIVVLNRIRDHHSLAATTSSWVLTAALYAVGWFVITYLLPRGTPDPGALLPGVAFTAAGLTLLQWFMQFWLPEQIAKSSELLGQLGFSIAMLGYLFFVARIMAMSFVVDAVLFERVGSLSRFVFALPLIRAVPRRYPSVGRFFDLDAETAR